ncbi:putative transcription regulator Homeodomain-LIKE family [Helianthus annuus]|uniref:ELM2 domain, Homeobox-like domain superfamily protein n=2 Tax=Helianthus annuus TaxID=4232 RepID=A0A251SU89_HELAN|nr:putative ELM2 domain, Homeobox-like domain superfamily protein [Helianthus annuus]KAJ0482060.1 putative transcription regulator Homeodomain-LIKE family [Helianthus annuus]KAJ0849979.1 putative transcription regulator Homeodomain-LIKE family [Helianthus annuus]KAJ0859032.1 putative transcription regulator Homeodomain-LIKE family [Helianthus annuus]
MQVSGYTPRARTATETALSFVSQTRSPFFQLIFEQICSQNPFNPYSPFGFSPLSNSTLKNSDSSNQMDQNDDCDSGPLETYAYGLYGLLGNIYRIRVGEEYQAEIPSLMTYFKYLDHIKKPFVEEEERKIGGLTAPIDFSIGLDIPVVWTNQENKNRKNDNALVPGCVLESWSEVEKGSFVLGMYIFRKDFVRLSRFMESKKVGDILSYYYGSFYRSDEYKRWSERRKARRKRWIMGQRIFSGVRQQEFLARLVPRVSQECQNELLEVSRTFGDAKISLEQYVFSIKTLIGIEKFIDAVAIGKGKQDLTGNAIEPTKQNQEIRIRPEIPVGKACSSLTSTEIVQFLTGDYRLSKNRSYDLFWEAVWPRLLARGWHSEQPNGYNYAANGKNNLVYLMPGVKRFSRKLVKGDAYLDCITDVLNKVASDPQLIEIDNEENGENEMKVEDEEENGFVEKRKSHCYLQPRVPKLNLGNVLVKFTVVDTSLRGGKIFRVRELDAVKLSLTSRSDESQSELVSSDVSDCENVILVDRETDVDRQKPAKKQKTCEASKNLEKQDVKTANGSDMIVKKAKLSRKPSLENHVHHAKRRRRLTACSRVDSKAVSSLDSHVGSSSQANNNNHKLTSNLSFTSRCSSVDTVDEQNQPQPMNLIDLNYPHVTPEFENNELLTEVKDEKIEPVPPSQSENIAGPKDQENGGSRRHGTRNRPPTAKALEAIANGFLTIHSRKGRKDKQESFSRNYQNAPGEVAVRSECSTGDASSAVKGDDENGEV